MGDQRIWAAGVDEGEQDGCYLLLDENNKIIGISGNTDFWDWPGHVGPEVTNGKIVKVIETGVVHVASDPGNWKYHEAMRRLDAGEDLDAPYVRKEEDDE